MSCMPLFVRLYLCAFMPFLSFGVFLIDIRKDGEERFHVLSADNAVHIVLCNAHDERRQAEHADQVRHGHQPVKGVGQIPGQTEVHGGSHIDDEDKHDLVGDGGFRTE